MKLTLCIAILCSLTITGCFSTPPHRSSTLSYNKSDEFKKIQIRRVLLLPFEYNIDREAVIDEVTEAFSVELRKIGSFEVVVPTGNKTTLLSEHEIWIKGSVNINTLVTLKKKYDADAIIFGNITNYRPYEPMLLGVKVGMISTDTGSVVWSADGVFDSNENEVAELVKQYFESTHQKSALYGWKLILLSMRRYSQFVANQITETLQY
ncbi:MAG: hypothetical protein HYV59_07035 [Planctomycetes bacterium]|nr:hypothetical protein [Planctomycetota bacterium]